MLIAEAALLARQGGGVTEGREGSVPNIDSNTISFDL